LKQPADPKNPERHVPLIVCGDFNGGAESGAVRFLEDGFIDESFQEDGGSIVSGRKALPLEKPLRDVSAMVVRGNVDNDGKNDPPATLVVSELISTMVKGQEGAYENPVLSAAVVERLERIYKRFATTSVLLSGVESIVMGVNDVEKWLIAINGQVGRGSEFREAARQMGWQQDNANGDDDEDDGEISADKPQEEKKVQIVLPQEGHLPLEGFLKVYQNELRGGKFWGIAYDLAVLGEPLPDAGTFRSRYDRIYCSTAIEPTAVMDFLCDQPCPNEREASDHLPVAASFFISRNEN